jgi:hypothetical protein
MHDSIGEACQAVQAAAAGKTRAQIREMLTAEFRSRDLPPLEPELFEVAVQLIAAGIYDPRKMPVSVSVHRTGLLRAPFFRKALRGAFDAALDEHGLEGVFLPHVVWVTDNIGDAWPMMSEGMQHPPGRGLYAPPPDQVPLPARLVPDPDLRTRMPEVFEGPPPPMPLPPDTRAPEGDELVFVWLEDCGGAVAVCCAPGRIGVLEAGDAEAYLPLLRVAAAQGQVVAATTDIGRTTPATVRVVPDRGLRAGTASPGG